LLDAFRAHYAQFQAIVVQVHSEPTDPFLLQLLGEDLNQFTQIVTEHIAIFESEEAQMLQNSIQTMILDIRALYNQRIDTSEISSFLDVSRSTLRRRLLEYGIASPGADPFPSTAGLVGDTHGVINDHSDNSDELLDAEVPQPAHLPEDVQAEASSIPSSSSLGYISRVSDEQLDSLLGCLRIHYHQAGIRILDGMLRCLSIIVPYECIWQSLIRIDPVHHVFDCIWIRRRGYSVPGPNSVWHHDGHHHQYLYIVFHLWVDVSHYISQTWHDMFTLLEIRHGLQVSNVNHIWLLQHLFLPVINDQLAFWAESWNSHQVSQHHGPAQSPEDMFVFDSLVRDPRGVIGPICNDR
ncbi:hypothetical protein C8R41DRAFT_941859, partial [Lentinula lateritia]